MYTTTTICWRRYSGRIKVLLILPDVVNKVLKEHMHLQVSVEVVLIT